jgi:XTP/dITP diphosphohydrolase
MIVVLFDPRRPSLVPVEAIEHLIGEVQYTEEMPVKVPWSLRAARPVHTGDDAPVLLSSDPDHPAVTARLAAGARLISAPESLRGERLVDAVAMMDKLRTAGPWESEQTHDSLRRFLLEETYEVLDAVRSGNADQLREELGDVLLQVLFHARIAEDASQLPFTIDDVATTLMRKLGNRVPGVLAGEPISLEAQLAQWSERKAAEKSRDSVMDDVHTGQPALALAQKVIQRVSVAGLPPELIPTEITSISVSADVDAENSLRAAVLEFADTVRQVEKTIAVARRGDTVPEEFDVTPLGEISAAEWRAYWPSGQVHTDPAPDPDPDPEPPAQDEPPEAPYVGEDVDSDADRDGSLVDDGSKSSKKRKGRR